MIGTRLSLAGVILVLALLPLAAEGQEGAAASLDSTLLEFESFFAGRGRARWTPVVSSGFDALLHTYPLATSDTTETIAEYFLAAGVEGRSSRTGSRRWLLRAEASAGSELFRQEIDARWSWRDGRNITRLKLDADLQGRQYRQGTEYSLSSDNLATDLKGRAYPWVGKSRMLEVRAQVGLLDYSTPSTLEVNHRETGAGVALRSPTLAETNWGVGYRVMKRAYPDSAGIDRLTHAFEADLDLRDDQDQSLRLYHRSNRRLIQDEDLKPSATSHWTDLATQVTAGSGLVFLDLQSEIWAYDRETEVYLDSWRLGGVMGYRWGEMFTTTWRLGVTAERFDAGDSPETYGQLGVRLGLESYGATLHGSVQVEYGRRHYEAPIETSPEASGNNLLEDFQLTYSDFHYVEIWIMGGWSINDRLSLDVLASYEPESHTEFEDDTSLGYASLRLVWKPSL